MRQIQSFGLSYEQVDSKQKLSAINAQIELAQLQKKSSVIGNLSNSSLLAAGSFWLLQTWWLGYGAWAWWLGVGSIALGVTNVGLSLIEYRRKVRAHELAQKRLEPLGVRLMQSFFNSVHIFNSNIEILNKEFVAAERGFNTLTAERIDAVCAEYELLREKLNQLFLKAKQQFDYECYLAERRGLSDELALNLLDAHERESQSGEVIPVEPPEINSELTEVVIEEIESGVSR